MKKWRLIILVVLIIGVILISGCIKEPEETEAERPEVTILTHRDPIGEKVEKIVFYENSKQENLNLSSERGIRIASLLTPMLYELLLPTTSNILEFQDELAFSEERIQTFKTHNKVMEISFERPQNIQLWHYKSIILEDVVGALFISKAKLNGSLEDIVLVVHKDEGGIYYTCWQMPQDEELYKLLLYEATGNDRIVFQDDGSIYLIDVDGSNKIFLNKGLDPAVLPDGKKIVYTKTFPTGGGRSINLGDLIRQGYGAAGGQRVMVSMGSYVTGSINVINLSDLSDDINLTDKAQDGGSLKPVWSPDGKKIAYTLFDFDNPGLYVMNADGTNKVKLLGERNRFHRYSPKWSPDGKKIAYVSGDYANSILYVINVDGTNKYLFSWDDIPGNDNVRFIEFLKQNFGIDWVETAKIEKIHNGTTIKVSTQKNYILLNLNYEQTEVILEIDDDRTDNFIVKIENSKLNLYTNKIKLAKNGWYPVWSPDGKKMVYKSGWHSSHTMLCLINADGTNKIVLSLKGGGAAWSPDGKKIVYVSDNKVYVMNVDKTNKIELAIEGWHPIWSPDGEKIAYIGGDVYDSEGIYVINADGSDKIKLTDKNVERYIVWSPDSEHIAFVSNSYDLYVANVNDGNLRLLTHGNERSSGISYIGWSPASK